MLLYLFLKTRFAIHTRTRTELKVSAIKRVQSKREKERERERENTSIAPSTLLFTPTTTFPVRLLPPRKRHVFVFYHVP